MTDHGGRRKNSGRKPHPLGVGVKTSAMIPKRLWEAINGEVKPGGKDTFSAALVRRLLRGRPRDARGRFQPGP